MKSICFMMPTVFNVGGEQRVVSALCNELIKEYNVSLLLFDNRYKEDYKLYNLDKKIKIYYINEYFNFSHKLCRKIRNLNSNYGFLKAFPIANKTLIKYSFPFNEVLKELNKIQPDIIIGVAGEFNLLASLIKFKIPKIKTIAWQHSNFDAYFNTKGRRHYNEKKLFCNMMKNIDKYIVLTKIDNEKMKKEFNINSECIYNIKSFSCDKKANLDSHQFISVGRFDEVKRFDLLIEAYNIYLKANPTSDWTLKIIGDGDTRYKLEKLIKNYNLESKIFLPGYKSNIMEEYLNSSIYIMTSKWEGFPMIISECMELGLPIISFDIDVMKEFIANSNTGILVESGNINKLANCMYELSKSKKIRETIARNEQQKIKELSPNKILQKWERIFEELEKNEN